jgi:hypothetical protein
VLDEVRIYARALSQAEIQSDMATPIGSGSGGSGSGGAGGSSSTSSSSGGGGGSSSTSSSSGGAGGSSSSTSSSSGGAGGSSSTSSSSGGAGGSSSTSSTSSSSGGAGGSSSTSSSSGGAGGSSTSGSSGGASGSGGGGSAGAGGSGGIYPLRLSSGRYLVDQGGAPFLIQGDAAWSLIANTTIEEATTYLSDRSARGFNTVLANLIEHDFAKNAPRNVYGDAPFTTPNDFATPNEAYFARADAVIRAAASRGIQVLLFPMYLGSNGGDEGWYQALVANGSTKARNWGVYVGNRYRSFDNIVWVMGGDYSPPDSGKALVNAVANGIKSVDTRHLMTEHGSSWAVSSMSDYAGQPWLDVDAVYVYEDNGAVDGDVLGEYNRTSWLPVFLIESQYENELSTLQGIRRQSYAALLNGAMGQVFGNSPIWCFSTNGGCIYGGPGDWRTSLDSPGARDQQRLHDLFAARAWWKLVPDQSRAFVTSGFSGASVERASDGTWGAAYLPSSRTMTVRLAGFTRSTTGKWFNPSTGSFTTIAGSPFANSGSVNVTPPAAGDWVLIFE